MAGNLLANAGFENSTGDDFDDWSKITTGSATITVETSDVYRGSQSIRFTPDGTSSCGILQYDKCEIGQEYTITFWAKGTAAGAYLNIITPFPSPGVDFALTTDWKKYSYTGIVDSTTVYIRRSELASIPFIVDNVSLVATPFKMAVLRGVLSADLDGTVDITETGFGTPKAAIVIIGTATVAEPVRAQNMPCIGFWDGSSQRCVWTSALSAAAPTNTVRGIESSYIGYSYLGAILYARYNIENITDGVRITTTYDNTSAARYAHVILFSGADVETDLSVFKTSSANDSYATQTGVGFRPDLLFVAGVGWNTSPIAAYVLSFGVASRYGLENRVVLVGNTDAVGTTSTCCKVLDDRCAGQYYTDVLTWGSDVTQFTADGFTMQSHGTTTNDDVLALALKIPGVQLKLDTFNGADSTGNDSITGVGFKPEYLMLANTMASGVNVDTDGLSFGIGAATASEEYCMSFIGEDAVATSREYSRSGTNINNLYHHTEQTAPYSRASLSSFDDDGFTLNFTEAASGTIGWYLAFADTTQNRKTFIQGV